MTFYHGPEVIEIDDGIRPIQTVRSAVIGVVGTAPGSAPEVKASLLSGSIAANNAIAFTSKLDGIAGNEIAIHLKDPKANSAALAVTVDGKKITASLATDEDGAVTTTATELISALTGSTQASALIGAANAGASTGAGVVASTFRQVFLTGGEDEAFPLNRPTLVAGNQRKAALLGVTGTLPEAAKGIFAQTGAVVIFVRVEEGEDDAATMQNVVGGVDAMTGEYTGVYSFLSAESEIGFCPRILIAPGFTHQRPDDAANPVVAELQGIADRLRATIVKDGPNTTDAAAILDRQDYGTKRVYIVDPHVKVMRDGQIINVPASSFVAGLIARIDNSKGFWKSPSNEEIFGIVGTARNIAYQSGDYNSAANLLNEMEVAVITRMQDGGFRLWGNRTTSSDPKWAFLSRVRTADMVNDSILREHLWAVDRNITTTYFEDVVRGVNAYMAKLQSQGAIAGGECWADKDLNPKEQIFSGQAVFAYEFSDSPPAERVTFRAMLTDRFLSEIL